MKKMLLILALIGLISIFPTKALAMLEVDENGNPVTKEIKDGEMSVMMAPDDSVSNDASNNDVELYTAQDTDDEIYHTTSAQEDAKTTAAVDEKETWPSAVLYGSLGILLGAGGTYFVMRKK